MTASIDTIQYSGLGISYQTTRAYDTHILPRWNGHDAAPAPIVANNKGYDVTTAISKARREAAYTRANATLCDGTYWWPMFVHDVNIDIALAGITAQAHTTWDFYPHNFTQPNFQVIGQSIDQRDYGDLTDFIHYTQRNSVTDRSKLQLYIQGRNGFDGHRQGGPGVTVNGAHYPNQMMRGSHQNLLCLGYVKTMRREHSSLATGPSGTNRNASDATTPTGTDAFASSNIGSGRGGSSFAPIYSFQFIVSDMITGPFQEDQVMVAEQQDWVAILQNTKTLQATHDLTWNNSWILNWAKQNSANILNSSAGG